MAGNCKRHRDRQSSRTAIVLGVRGRVRRFSGDRLQVVATSPAMQTDTEVLGEFPQQRLQSFAD